MRYTREILLAAMAGPALWGAGAFAQAVTPQGFVTKATLAGMTEIGAARLALKDSHSEDAIRFAQRMIKDHTQAAEELASIANGKNLKVPARLDSSHRAVLSKLGNLSGAEFDAAYAKQMVADHQEAVALFTSEAADKTDPDLSAFAQKTLPTLQDHLGMANSLAAAHGPHGEATGATNNE
jgi:putative membrane protein